MVATNSMLAMPCRASAIDTLTGARLRAGEPGNEAGYVVAMTDDTLATPYKVVPGTRVRLESAYDGTSKRLGVMGCARPAWRTRVPLHAPLQAVASGQCACVLLAVPCRAVLFAWCGALPRARLLWVGLSAHVHASAVCCCLPCRGGGGGACVRAVRS